MLLKVLATFFSDTTRFYGLLDFFVTPPKINYHTIQYHTNNTKHLPYNISTHVIHLFTLKILISGNKREVFLHLTDSVGIGNTRSQILLHSSPPSFIQPLLQSPPTIPSSTAANFHLIISRLYLLFHLIITTIPTSTVFLYSSAIFRLPIFTYSHSYNPQQISFPLSRPLSNSGCVKDPMSK